MREDRRELAQKIAAERIGILFGLAERKAGSDSALSHRYVLMLKRIAAHYKVGLPKNIRNGICAKCNHVLVPGLNSTVRVVSSKGYMAYRCAGCGAEKHVFYKKSAGGR